VSQTEEADIDTKHAAAVTGVAHRSSEELRKDIFAASGIFLFAFALYLLPAVQSRPLKETPEARVAVVAREMIERDNYIVPTMGGEVRLNKPPLPYWLVASAAKLLKGEDGLTLRVMTNATLLPPALLVACALFIVVLYGSLVFGRTGGVVAGLLLGLGQLVAVHAQLGYGDSVLLFTTCWMYCSAAWLVTTPRPGMLTALSLGASLGLGILTKGHIPVVLLVSAVALAAVRYRRLNTRKVILFIAALAISSASLWWFVSVKQAEPQAWAIFMKEASEGFSDANSGHIQNDPWTKYIYTLAGGMLPWTPLLLLAFVIYLTRPKPKEPEDSSGIILTARENMLFFAGAFLTGFLCFYIYPKQQPHYLLPIIPPLALAGGYLLSQFKAPGGFCEERLAWTQLIFGVLAAAAVGSFPFWPPAQKVAMLAGVNGLMFSVPLAVAVFAAYFYSARQWVEGKPLVGVATLAVAAYVGLGGWSIYMARQSRENMLLSRHAEKVRQELENLAKDPEIGANFNVYALSGNLPLNCFYLQRPVKSEKMLAEEPADKSKPDTARRVLVFERSEMDKILNEYDIAVKGSVYKGEDKIVVLALPSDRNWPAHVEQIRKSRKQKRESDE